MPAINAAGDAGTNQSGNRPETSQHRITSGCPKNRFTPSPDGEPGLNHLCAGYKHFYDHSDEPMQTTCDLLREGRAPVEPARVLAARKAERYTGVGRNDPCPCGSGLTYQRCHRTEAPSA